MEELSVSVRLFIYLCCLCCSNFLRLSCLPRFNRQHIGVRVPDGHQGGGILNVDEKVAQSARAIPSLLFLDSLHPAGRLHPMLSTFSQRDL